MSELFDLIGKDEPLHPDLAACIYRRNDWDILHHPLLIDVPYHPAMNALHNRRYEHTRERLEKARGERDWGRYIFLHERPYRVPALREAVSNGLEPGSPEYWELVGQVWIDTENVHEEFRTWAEIWDHPGSRAVMDEAEQIALLALPNMIEVWRGVKRRASVKGLSWTTNKDKAIWFARRWLGKKETPYLAHGLIMRGDVKAYLLGRGESEIVALPGSVQILDVGKLSRKK